MNYSDDLEPKGSDLDKAPGDDVPTNRMDPDFHARVYQLFMDINELPRAERIEAARIAAGDDGELLKAVVGMLQAQPNTGELTDMENEIVGSIAHAIGDTFGSLEPDAQVDHYRVIEKIGEGGMGIVYKVEDTRLNVFKAMKVLHYHMAGNENHRERFRKEARVLAQTTHANIVTIHDFHHHEQLNLDYLVMELIDGDTLSHRLPEDGFPLKMFLDLAIPITAGVLAAHNRGVIHRDLKPGNIMVDRHGGVKILDFGLARLRPPDGRTLATLTRGFWGTMSYASPEQLEERKLDKRTDIFSLGVIFQEMLTGARPFGGHSGAAIVTAILRDKPASLSDIKPGIPQELERLVERCLAKRQEDRWESLSEVLERLINLRRQVETHEAMPVDMKDEAKADVGEAPSEESPKQVRSQWRWLLPVSVILVVLTAFIVPRWFRNQRHHEEARILFTRALKLYIAEGKEEEAFNQVEEALSLYPGFAQAHNLQSFCEETRGDKQAALESATLARDLLGNVENRVMQNWILGNYHMNRLEYDKSLKAYQKAFDTPESLWPEWEGAFTERFKLHLQMQLSHCHSALGETGNAVKSLRDIVRTQPIYSGSLIVALAEDNQFDEALELYEDLRANDSEVYFNWGGGLAYMGKGEYLEAERAFRRMEASENRSFKSWGSLLLGKAQIFLGQYDEAVSLQKVYIPFDGENQIKSLEKRRILLAHLLVLMGRREEALAQLEAFAVPEARLYNMRGLHSLAFSYAELEQRDRCEILLKQMEELSNQTDSLLLKLARAHVHLRIGLLSGLSDEAIVERIQNARSHNIELKDPRVLISTAIASRLTGDYIGARTDLLTLKEREGHILREYSPTLLAQAELELARCAARLGETNLAKDYYKAFLKNWGRATRWPEVIAAQKELANLGN